MTPEAKQKAKVKKILESLCAYYVMPIGGPYARNGVADFLVCLPGGRFAALEIKAGKGKATLLQLRELEKVQQCGGLALVVDDSNVDKLEPLLKREMEKEWTP